MTIEWSKAPEGHDYHLEWIYSNGQFYRDGGDRFFRDNGSYALKSDIPSDVVITKRPVEWTGEGLPPVGTVCEVNHPTMNWVRCEIVAHKHFDCGSKPHAIAWIDGDNLDQSQGNRFRPIRTPEQIAEEDRENYVQIAMGDTSTLGISDTSKRILIERLYDSGHRKQVTE